MTNSKSTKRALLLSALSILMCVAMLVGTTFAWFTDTASTAVNKIQAGTLDVALEMFNGEKWVPAENTTLDFVKAAEHTDEAILWEPGCTYNLPELRIVNKGNLALKYKVVISGINGDAKLNEAIDWTIGDVAMGTEQHLAAGAADEFTIKGHMLETAGNEYQGLTIDGIAITVYATQDTVEYDSNNNLYDAGATLPSFWDGKTVTNPTKGADGKYHITSAAEFVAYIKNTNTGNSYVLDRDIDLSGYTITFSDGDSRVLGSNFDGKNHIVSNFTLTGSRMYVSLFGYTSPDKADRTVKNLTVKNATVISTSESGQAAVILAAANTANGQYTVTVDNCKVYDSTVIGKKKVATVVGYTEGGTITNCYAENCNVYCEDTKNDQAGPVVGYINTSGVLTDKTSDNTAKNVTVKTGAKGYIGGSVNITENQPISYVVDATVTVATGEGGYHRIYSDNATFVNCVFNGDGYLWFKDTATFINCTFNTIIYDAEPVTGTVTFENCIFNKQAHFAPGSATASADGKFFVAHDCEFNDDLTVQGFEKVTVENCRFSGNNWAKRNMISYCPLVIDNCTFTTGIRLSYSDTSKVTCTNGTVELEWTGGSAIVGN